MTRFGFFLAHPVWLLILSGLPAGIAAEGATAEKAAICGPGTADEGLRRIVQDFSRIDGPGPGDPALVAFGRQLFFDRKLSRDATVSCAHCHVPELGFTDGKAVAEALSRVDRNTPTLLNVYRGGWFFWDGRADSLESQALQPLENPREHGFTRTEVVNAVIDRYHDAYESAFGPLPGRLIGAEPLPAAMPRAERVEVSANMLGYGLATLGELAVFNRIVADAAAAKEKPVDHVLGHYVNRPPSPNEHRLDEAWSNLPAADREAVNRVFANVARALAAFERTLVANDSPFDRFAGGWKEGCAPDSAFNEGFGARELAGLRVFTGEGRCVLCHNGPAFSDGQFHNIGLPDQDGRPGFGRTAGLRRAQADPFNCRSRYFRQDMAIVDSETCREAEFLDTENLEMLGAFKTPTLRNLALTAPYGHDGRFASLREVLDHYNTLEARPAIGHTEETLVPLGFDEARIADLIAFLASLNSPHAIGLTELRP